MTLQLQANSEAGEMPPGDEPWQNLDRTGTAHSILCAAEWVIVVQPQSRIPFAEKRLDKGVALLDKLLQAHSDGDNAGQGKLLLIAGVRTFSAGPAQWKRKYPPGLKPSPAFQTYCLHCCDGT